MSSFVSHLTSDLTERIQPPTSVPPTPPGGSNVQPKETLRGLFVQLNQPSQEQDTSHHLGTLQEYRDRQGALANDDEEAALQRAVLGKLAIDLYGQALDVVLEDARRVEDELEWWADLERSSSSVALYFIQSKSYTTYVEPHGAEVTSFSPPTETRNSWADCGVHPAATQLTYPSIPLHSCVPPTSVPVPQRPPAKCAHHSSLPSSTLSTLQHCALNRTPPHSICVRLLPWNDCPYRLYCVYIHLRWSGTHSCASRYTAVRSDARGMSI